MQFKSTTAIVSFLAAWTATATAMKCTEGIPLTSDELTELETLNNTTGWAPMEKITHCTLEASDIKSDTGSINDHKLEARGGGNRFTARSAYGCSGSTIFDVHNFGCCACITIPSGAPTIKSGTLWREKLSGAYPTMNYYRDAQCQGTDLGKQGILSGQYSSCQDAADARSVIVCQGC